MRGIRREHGAAPARKTPIEDVPRQSSAHAEQSEVVFADCASGHGHADMSACDTTVLCREDLEDLSPWVLG